MSRHRYLPGLLILAALSLDGVKAQEKVAVKVVTYSELGQLVRQHVGKVVVVDLWATW
jgi:thiol:disulfide interchange protein